ncbi:MAG: hypothetical protein DRQ48_01000 [Gammaproteobacteria bacterium]|nr:MAG: hypothetical protein DRQ44_00370 [Gammaproteobacteria bacterium]RKZ72257.1 MAG: hypothetical protein DRQ48_01000 [Gammaproteobacteria bacterium]
MTTTKRAPEKLDVNGLPVRKRITKGANEYIGSRLTREEKDLIYEAAKSLRLTIGAYILEASLERAKAMRDD